MSEIEKLYANAGIEKDCVVMHECLSTHSKCKNCNKTFYPPFTAEKQLELIKWLVHKSILSITIASNNDYHVCGFGWTGDFKADFNEAIASYINNLWQDLTEEERKQIKEILE